MRAIGGVRRFSPRKVVPGLNQYGGAWRGTPTVMLGGRLFLLDYTPVRATFESGLLPNALPERGGAAPFFLLQPAQNPATGLRRLKSLNNLTLFDY